MHILKKIKSKNKVISAYIQSQEQTIIRNQLPIKQIFQQNKKTQNQIIQQKQLLSKQKSIGAIKKCSSKLSRRPSQIETKSQSQLSLENYLYQKQNIPTTLGPQKYCYLVKKANIFGDICVFDGQLQNCRPMKMSCSISTINNPQFVDIIKLNDYCAINDNQGYFSAKFISQVIQKKH